MCDAFNQAFAKTMTDEGRYTESGPTFCGIDRRFWPSWQGWPIVDSWIRGEITSGECDAKTGSMVMDFYRAQFWDRLRGDAVAEIDRDIAIRMFNAGVNCGIHRAVSFLQRAINRLNRNGMTYRDVAVDGVMGNGTINALRSQLQTSYGGSVANAKRLLKICYSGEQYQHYSALSDHEQWPGWFLRLEW